MKFMKKEQSVPVLLITSSALLSITGLYWLAFSGNDERSLLIVGSLLLVEAFANLLGAYLYIERHKYRVAFVVAVLITNILATVADQLGVYDAVFLLFQAFILVVVLKHKIMKA